MTSQPNEQQEPSMEEILSSIRRIIADEGSEGAEGEGASPEVESKELDLSDGASEAAAREEEDVLELTEVVHDDVPAAEPEVANVVNLETAAAHVQPAATEFEAPEPEDFDPEPHDFRADSQDFQAKPEDFRTEAEDLAPDSHDLEPAQQVVPDQHQADPEPAFAAERSMAELSDEAVEADDSFAEPVVDMPGAPEAILEPQDELMENHEMPMRAKENGGDSLVSDVAAGVATGAFAKLSQAVQRTPPEIAVADDSGRSVEQFAEDMMRPMLREWLDVNLPAMVERIVQKEIQKIVRRAEDD
ncbi:MAG: DUF2497 domain-containing protein [Pseudomonadota bacterium]